MDQRDGKSGKIPTQVTAKQKCRRFRAEIGTRDDFGP